jgi:hypothetical protein
MNECVSPDLPFKTHDLHSHSFKFDPLSSSRSPYDPWSDCGPLDPSALVPLHEALQAVSNLCATGDLYHLIPPLRFAVRFFRDNGVPRHALQFPFDRRVLEYFVGIFGRPDITQELKSLLIPIFVDYTFEYPGFSSLLASSDAFETLQTLELPRVPAELTIFLKLIHNLAAAHPSRFSDHFLMRLANGLLAARRDDRTAALLSFSLINFFRCGPISSGAILAEFVQKFTARPLPERVAVNVGWCLYFGARRSADFIRAIIRRPIVEFLAANVTAQNDTLSRLALHVLSLTCTVGEVIAPIEDVIGLVNRRDDVADAAIQLCANWAALGAECTRAIMATDIVLDLLAMFDSAPRDVKGDIAWLFAVLCWNADAADVTVFATEAKIKIFEDALGMDDPQLSECVVNALVKVGTIAPNVAEWIDRSTIEEAVEASVLEECSRAAGYILTFLDGK